MDHEGSMQWKWYSSIHDESYGKNGYSYSFTYIPSFIEYLENGDILCELDAQLYLAQEGDVIAIDFENCDLEEMAHVVLVTDVIREEDGEIRDLLICGNTNDQLDYPLSALTYPYKKLIRIYGNRA